MGTELQTAAPTALTATKYKTPCSALQSDPQLARLVDDTHPHTQRVITAAERDRLAALLPFYEATLAPIERGEFDRMMGRLALGYPNAKVSDAEADERLALYAKALGDVPGDILGRAFLAAVQTQKFFPSIAELRAGCGEFALRQWRAARIRHLIAIHDAEPPPDNEPRCTAEDAARIIRDVGLNLDGPVANAMPEWMREALTNGDDAPESHTTRVGDAKRIEDQVPL